MLHTPRLLLRPFVNSDVDDVHRLLYADPLVANAWTGLSRDYPDVQQRLATDPVWRVVGGYGFRAIVLRDRNAVIGLMGFQAYAPGEDTSFIIFPDGSPSVGSDPTSREAELTYALGSAYWGHGCATEAGRALLGEGFVHLEITRIVNAVRAANTRSITLMRRLGFRILANMWSAPDGVSVIGVLDRPTALSP